MHTHTHTHTHKHTHTLTHTLAHTHTQIHTHITGHGRVREELARAKVASDFRALDVPMPVSIRQHTSAYVSIRQTWEHLTWPCLLSRRHLE